jgi:hypothetical protein
LLTDIVIEAPVTPLAEQSQYERINSIAVQEQIRIQLLAKIDSHLNTVFAQKLHASLEHAQRQVIEAAINELKAELPEILKNTLDTTDKNDKN